MNNEVSKRRAISLLAVFGVILVLMATWNSGEASGN